MSEEVLKILLSILAAALSGGIGILTIYLKSRWRAENFARVLGIVDEMVRAAEMVGAAAGWDGEAKKKQALTWAVERTGLSEAELENYIEAAVARLKAAGEELTKKAGAVVVKS
jgi:small ligand-binding sensory domain FIST